MISWITRIANRIRALRHTKLEGDQSLFLFDKRVRFVLEPGSEIIIRDGQLRLGYPLPGATPYASQPETVIHIQRGGKWLCSGAVAIAPGANIKIGENARLVMDGDSLIAQNFTLLCNQAVHIGRSCHFSWGVTLIDDDGHRLVRHNGQEARRISKPLWIGDQVAIQMNVQVPAAVNIGDRAVIGAGTVLRQDVPANCVAYAETLLRINDRFASAVRAPSLELVKDEEVIH